MMAALHQPESNMLFSAKKYALGQKAQNPCYNVRLVGSVAQLVEQRIENPRVGGSSPPRATNKIHESQLVRAGFFVLLESIPKNAIAGIYANAFRRLCFVL